MGRTARGGWFWEADTLLVIEAMRDHLALCEAGRVMTALAGVEMFR